MRGLALHGTMVSVSDLPLQVPLPARAGGGSGPRQPPFAPPAAPPLTLTVLGPFAARRGRVQIDAGGLNEGEGPRLIRFLLAHRDRAVTEAEVVAGLWPGARATTARRSVRVAVADARLLLDDPVGRGTTLCTADGTYRLCLGWHDRVDADHFEAAATMALRTHGPRRRTQVERALALWSGTPLPEERDSQWAAAWRERLVECHATLQSALDAMLPQTTAAAS